MNAGDGMQAEPLITAFERLAAGRPDALAVWSRADVLDYRRLNAAADRVASLLLRRGLGRGDRVGLLVPRSAELVVSVLGAWKAGLCWVPLDPDWPSSRIAQLLDDCRPEIVLTTAAAVVDPRYEALVVRIEREPAELSLADRSVLDQRRRELSPQDPAYVIYTSGSTGRPKGVVIAQASLAHYCHWAASAYPGVRQAALLHSPLSFDLSITSLIPPLLSGGAIYLGSLEADPMLTSALRQNPLGILKVTPSHLPLLDVLPDEFLPSGQLIVGGEQLYGAALSSLARRASGLVVINEYGPTETTVGCAFHRLRLDGSVLPDVVPIGRPAPSVLLSLSDQSIDGQGRSGELVISGPGVAQGYLGQPELTRERFAEADVGGGFRSYKTGDIVRQLGSGDYEYVGRTDDQLKVRSFRIEPAEVEAVLSKVPGVSRVVVAGDAGRGSQATMLVAYFVGDHDLQPAVLRAAAASLLPTHMVPAAYIAMAQLPLTYNGKVDRAALPEPDFVGRPEIAGW